MLEFKPEEIARTSERLKDGRRCIRYTHIPSGISVERFTGKADVVRMVNEEPYCDLRAKIAEWKDGES